MSAADQLWFAQRGPGQLVKRIHIPTLIVQGTVDTLFTLDEGIVNYRLLKSVGTRVSMLWFCGGHGTCLTKPGNRAIVQDATHRLDEPLAQARSAHQHGTACRYHRPERDPLRRPRSYPIPSSSPLTGQGSGTLSLLATGGAGPVVLPAVSLANPDPLAALVGPITPAKATNAVDVAIPSRAATALAVGAPQLRFTYHGTIPAGPRPTRVFAQLVDERYGLVLGNQITPIDVTLDGATHTVSVPLETVAQAVAPGHGLTLQLVATTVAYSPPQLGGSVTFDRIRVSVPVVKPSAVKNLGSRPRVPALRLSAPPRHATATEPGGRGARSTSSISKRASGSSSAHQTARAVAQPVTDRLRVHAERRGDR